MQPLSAVIIEKYGRINAVDIQPHRIRPRPVDIWRSYHEVPAAVAPLMGNQRAHNPELLPIVANRGRIQPARRANPLVIELVFPRDDVPTLAPVRQVGAVKYGQAGEILERRRN